MWGIVLLILLFSNNMRFTLIAFGIACCCQAFQGYLDYQFKLETNVLMKKQLESSTVFYNNVLKKLGDTNENIYR